MDSHNLGYGEGTTPPIFSTASLSNSTSDLYASESEVIEPYTPLQASLIGISAGLLSFVTIAGNLMVMISFKMDKQLQTISNYFLFSLAVADIIIGLISMPLFTVFLIQQEWTFGVTICDTWLSVDYLASNASVLNLLVISFDRYFSVTRPLTYRVRRTTRKAALMIFSAWAVSVIVWPPWIFAWPYIEGIRTVPDNDCYIQFIYSNEYMSIVTVMIAFFVPVSVMIGLYVRVWWETVKRQRELVHLQGGKKVNSKRSDSSDEAIEEVLSKKGLRIGNMSSIGSTRSKESQDITYVPTALFKSRSSANSLHAVHRSRSCCVGLLVRLCGSCIDSDRGFGLEEASSEGYMTPRSIETPVQLTSKCPSLNLIRDPYATRFPILRPSASVEEKFPSSRQLQQHLYQPSLGQSQILERASHERVSPPIDILEAADGMKESNIFTILIRLPPAKTATEKSPYNQGPVTGSKHKQRYDSVVKTPSIQMLPDPSDDDDEVQCAPGLGPLQQFQSSSAHSLYPQSLSPIRRVDSESRSAGSALRQGFRSAAGSINRCGSHTSSYSHGRDRHQRQHSYGTALDKLPLETKLVPRQLIRAGDEGAGVASTNPGSNSSLPSTVTMGGNASKANRGNASLQGNKTKKASTEKKQDRKAAKTLSAILLAFVVTWTPYSVLVVLNAILGKQLADMYIPDILWQFSYYLCYINSTVNPVLYALCNAAFRRTYVRILTCRWGSRSRQPINRYYYG